MQTLLSFPYDLSVGSVHEFSYPQDNRLLTRTRLSRRRILIQKVRDLVYEPLRSITLRRRPDLRRCRYLVIGQDVAKSEWRSFYLDSMRRRLTVEIQLYRLAMYCPMDDLDDGDPQFFGPIWTDSRSHQRTARDLVKHFNARARAMPGYSKVCGLLEINDP